MSMNVGQEKWVILEVLRAEHGVALEGDGIHDWVEERAGEYALKTGLKVREKDLGFLCCLVVKEPSYYEIGRASCRERV